MRSKRARLKTKLDKLVSEYVKKRDNYTCQHCGKRVDGSNCHVSHVIPRSHGDHLRWDPMNLKVLCFHCHINWWHKNPIESGEWFKSKFPERWNYLQKEKNKIHKFTIEELENLVVELKKKGSD